MRPHETRQQTGSSGSCVYERMAVEGDTTTGYSRKVSGLSHKKKFQKFRIQVHLKKRREEIARLRSEGPPSFCEQCYGPGPLLGTPGS